MPDPKDIKKYIAETAQQLRQMESRLTEICQRVNTYIQNNGKCPKLKQKSQNKLGQYNKFSSKPEAL